MRSLKRFVEFAKERRYELAVGLMVAFIVLMVEVSVGGVTSVFGYFFDEDSSEETSVPDLAFDGTFTPILDDTGWRGLVVITIKNSGNTPLSATSTKIVHPSGIIYSEETAIVFPNGDSGQAVPAPDANVRQAIPVWLGAIPTGQTKTLSYEVSMVPSPVASSKREIMVTVEVQELANEAYFPIDVPFVNHGVSENTSDPQASPAPGSIPSGVVPGTALSSTPESQDTSVPESSPVPVGPGENEATPSVLGLPEPPKRIVDTPMGFVDILDGSARPGEIMTVEISIYNVYDTDTATPGYVEIYLPDEIRIVGTECIGIGFNRLPDGTLEAQHLVRPVEAMEPGEGWTFEVDLYIDPSAEPGAQLSPLFFFRVGNFNEEESVALPISLEDAELGDNSSSEFTGCH